MEKKATDNQSPFTWCGNGESLEDLEKPERMKSIEEHHKKRQEKDREKLLKDLKKNPFLKDEDLELHDFMDDADVSSSCLICHK